jgi:cation-transporting ATPase E
VPTDRSSGPPDVGGGLDAAAVAARTAAGLVNRVPRRTSRPVREIVRANVFTRFNALLGGLLAVILVVGPLQDALFGIVLVTNTLIGIVQELRAKRSLDRLALLNAPRARVVRGGVEREIPADQVVLDDLVVAVAGDQVVVDGVVVDATGLEVDESLLTGESEPVPKGPGDEVLSGSFVAAGTCRYRATGVGESAYAAALAAEARRFRLVRSELRDGINAILRLVTWVILPAGGVLVASQLTTHHHLADALRGSVAGVGSMVPEGLVLLTSVAFAVGALRLARRRVLVQELAAVEGLARVDVLCLDKTGTITEPELAVVAVEPAGGGDPAGLRAALGALAAADPSPNATIRAVRSTCPAPADWQPTHVVPFSSARKWAGADFGPHGTWVMGGGDVLVPPEHPLAARVESEARAGRRVLVAARAGGLDGERPVPPVRPAALVLLEERVRPDAPETLGFFRAEGIALKVISGDHPATVATIAARAGLPGADDPVDARHLPEHDPAAFAALLEARSVFGRVTPHQKRAMVAALQARGHVVAMTGDGVNDVLALKDADLGIAMGTGSAAARAVAPVVLLDAAFAALPAVFAEGRRVIANIERVANLFVTKTVYALLLALSVGAARLPFPFLPRHLTIVSSLTIGIPAFFLALAPNAARSRPGFVGRVLRFAVPAGTVAAAATFAGYALARSDAATTPDEARTTATLVLLAVGLEVLSILARPFSPARGVLFGSMAAAFAGLLAVPAARRFFALDVPRPIVLLAAVGIIALAVAALDTGWRIARWAGARSGRSATPDGDLLPPPPARPPGDH